MARSAAPQRHSAAPAPAPTTLILTARQAILASVWTVLLLALPMWWKTTEIHRAPIPSERIRQWEAFIQSPDLKITSTVQLSVVSPAADAAAIARQVQQRLNALLELAGSGSGAVSLLFEVAAARLDSADEWRPKEGVLGTYSILASCAADSEAPRVDVLANRALKIVVAGQCTDEAIASVTVATLGGLFAGEQLDYVKELKRSGLEDSKNTIDHDRMRRMKFAPEYLLTLSLFNADPETLLVDWDIAPAVRAYLNPFLDALSVLYNFTVSSQVQHYATLAIKPEKAVGHEGEYYYLRPKDLPLFINSAEWNFGASAVSTSPPMNFIVYVPQASQSPLYVVGSDGTQSATNGFLIPQWGGIVIANPTRPVDTIGGRFHFDVDELRPAFEVFVAQLRGLLGVEAVSIPAPERLLPGYAVTYGQSGTGVTGWEVDRVVRRSVAHNVRDAVGAMASLATLIEKMENMVVLDHISDELTTALDALDGARAALSASPDRGREPLDLAAVARTARNAAVAAERAFFDPTMVSLLYFPTEHKYAVYMPLFTPILVPLAIALVKEVQGALLARRLKKAAAGGAKLSKE